jgi:U2-associated protein SR140
MAFESRLRPVFAHLHDVLQSLDAYSGKVSADVFRGQILAVLEVWERWQVPLDRGLYGKLIIRIVYTQDVSDALRGLFEGSQGLDDDLKAKEAELELLERQERELREKAESSSSKFKASGFKSSFKPIGEAVTASIAVNDKAADLDGEPLNDEDLDGEELEDVDGQSIDGEAMSDLDGDAMDDLDGGAI